MTIAPPLLHGRRRGLAAALVALAMGEALLVVLFAARLDHLLSGIAPTAAATATAGAIAIAAAAALLLQRWVGELFAQAFVADCRAVIFAALARQRSNSEGIIAESRWLTALINDMASMRNYALRGTVRLWTSATAAGAASLWVAAAIPQLRIGLVPLALGTAAILFLTVPLSRAILDQRRVRGRLNRFMVRRVQADARRGHGFRKLASLSDELSRAAVCRAARVGAMETAATLSGLLAALLLVRQASGPAGAAGIAGHLTLIAFIAARQLESARALQARIGGRIALDRLAGLIASAPPPRRARSTNRLRLTSARRSAAKAAHAEQTPSPTLTSVRSQEPFA